MAGGLTLEDAARVVALRSRALASLAGLGGMLALAVDAASAETLIEPFGDRVSIAAVNGPSSVVASGEPDALEELRMSCERSGLRARTIAVDYAAHSAQVEQTREILLKGCARIEPKQSDVPFYSAVTGGALDTGSLGADYWYRNLREPVRFEQATEALLDAGVRTFIEASPHPVLTGSVQEIVETRLQDGDHSVEAEAVAIGTLRRDLGNDGRFLHALADMGGRCPGRWSAVEHGVRGLGA